LGRWLAQSGHWHVSPHVQPDPASVVKVLKGGTTGVGPGTPGKSKGGRSSRGMGVDLGEGGAAVGTGLSHESEVTSDLDDIFSGDGGVRGGDEKSAAARASVSRLPAAVRVSEALLLPLGVVVEAKSLLCGASAVEVLQPQFHTSSHWQGFRREATARETKQGTGCR
jgi:hypothetical protein